MTTLERVLFLLLTVAGIGLLVLYSILNKQIKELNDQLYNDELRLWALEPRVWELEEKLDSLTETVDILSDAETVADITAGESEAQTSNGVIP